MSVCPVASRSRPVADRPLYHPACFDSTRLSRFVRVASRVCCFDLSIACPEVSEQFGRAYQGSSGYDGCLCVYRNNRASCEDMRIASGVARPSVEGGVGVLRPGGFPLRGAGLAQREAVGLLSRRMSPPCGEGSCVPGMNIREDTHENTVASLGLSHGLDFVSSPIQQIVSRQRVHGWNVTVV